MKFQNFKLIFLISQCHLIIGYPGIVDSPELRKSREKVTRAPSLNAITNNENYEIKSTTPASSTSSLQTFKITHDDVVMGTNSVYGSHFDQSNVRLSGGGILFAVNGQGITSSPQIMTAAPPQPVLLQYLTPEGTPKQSAIQYIQVLRPLNMMPPQPYLAPRPLPTLSEISMEAKPIQKSIPLSVPSSYTNSSPIGAHSTQLTSYSRASTPHREMSLNMNEYMPAASSRVSTMVLSPRANPYMTLNKFQTMAQRA